MSYDKQGNLVSEGIYDNDKKQGKWIDVDYKDHKIEGVFTMIKKKGFGLNSMQMMDQ